MYGGRIVRELSDAEISETAIMRPALGEAVAEPALRLVAASAS